MNNVQQLIERWKQEIIFYDKDYERNSLEGRVRISVRKKQLQKCITEAELLLHNQHLNEDAQPQLPQAQCKTLLPLKDELTAILKDIHAVEENQILGNHKECRRLLLKAITDLSGVIKRQ